MKKKRSLSILVFTGGRNNSARVERKLEGLAIDRQSCKKKKNHFPDVKNKRKKNVKVFATKQKEEGEIL